MPDVAKDWGQGCWCGAQVNDVLVDADGVEERALSAEQVARLGPRTPCACGRCAPRLWTPATACCWSAAPRRRLRKGRLKRSLQHQNNI